MPYDAIWREIWVNFGSGKGLAALSPYMNQWWFTFKDSVSHELRNILIYKKCEKIKIWNYCRNSHGPLSWIPTYLWPVINHDRKVCSRCLNSPRGVAILCMSCRDKIVLVNPSLMSQTSRNYINWSIKRESGRQCQMWHLIEHRTSYMNKAVPDERQGVWSEE